MQRDELLLRDIAEAADAIELHIADLSLDIFIQVRVVRSAVLHELTVIGEAAGRLSDDLRNRYPDVPWSQIIGFRHVIVHGYAGLNWERVWRTITNDVPQLNTRIRAILAAEFPKE